MSPRTATKHIAPVDDDIEPSTETQPGEESMPITGSSEPIDTITIASQPVAVLDAGDGAAVSQTMRALEGDSASADSQVEARVDVDTQTDVGDIESESQTGRDPAPADGTVIPDTAFAESTLALLTADGEDHPDGQYDQPDTGSTPDVEHAPAAMDSPDTLAPNLPDPSSISGRLRNLVVTVGQVEELSRRARETAASDLALYDAIAASHRQFEEGLAEAQRIGHEAADVYKRAFGQEAKVVAEPAVIEAGEIEQAFAELADAWRQQAESFLVQHPDVESLLADQRQQDEEARRREIARTKAERFQQLVNGADAALRQGLLDDARDCLRMLGSEFPAEADRVKPLHDRLQHKIRAANDAAARRVLVQASELQGRGEFNAAVRLLEAVDVQGLSREASEDVFGRWSAACSLLAQTGGLELLRYSPTQGRGIILHHDPSVPYGLVEFSSLGMGPSHFEGRVVSAADREGSVIVSRARSFRAAEVPAELNVAWYGTSYVTPGGTSAVPIRH